MKYFNKYRAKSNKLGGTFLFEHGYGAAKVCEYILDNLLPPHVVDKIHRDIIFLTAIHDVGKIWDHQQQIFKELDRTGYSTPLLVRHEQVSAMLFKAFFGRYKKYQSIILQHHDKSYYLDKGDSIKDECMLDSEGNITDIWYSDGFDYIREMQKLFFFEGKCDGSYNTELMLGLLSLSDWISSQWFGNDIEDIEDKIGEVLHGINLFVTEAIQDFSFKDLTSYESPNSMQKTCIDMAQEYKRGLYIIEANTGSGKTEAALTMAYHLNKNGTNKGVFFGLPTQLTADKIHQRATGFFDTFSKMGTNLLHADASLRDRDKRIDDWYRSPKKAILTKYGVGTIDQSMMATMHVKHNFIRLLGLAGKVVILDEIHSYDYYMTAIIKNLIDTLISIGCTVILVSATIPTVLKKEYLGDEVFDKSYPLISFKGGNGIFRQKVVADFETTQEYRFRRHCVAYNYEKIVDLIIKDVRNGKNVVLMCNTVPNAQKYFELISKRSHELQGAECDILHSRFIKERRTFIETKWTDLLGKDAYRKGERPQGSILVATQIIEQSLDIDADVLYTELAPVDRLLQRLGRLFRHSDIKRDHGAICHILLANWIDEKKEIKSMKELNKCFASSSLIYPPFLLYRTHNKVCKKYYGVKLPDMTRELIDSVYINEEDLGLLEGIERESFSSYLASKQDLQQHAQKSIKKNKQKIQDEEKARTRFINAPNYKIVICDAIDFIGKRITVKGTTYSIDENNDYKLQQIFSDNSINIAEYQSEDPDSLGYILDNFENKTWDNCTRKFACPLLLDQGQLYYVDANNNKIPLNMGYSDIIGLLRKKKK